MNCTLKSFWTYLIIGSEQQLSNWIADFGCFNAFCELCSHCRKRSISFVSCKHSVCMCLRSKSFRRIAFSLPPLAAAVNYFYPFFLAPQYFDIFLFRQMKIGILYVGNSPAHPLCSTLILYDDDDDDDVIITASSLWKQKLQEKS